MTNYVMYVYYCMKEVEVVHYTATKEFNHQNPQFIKAVIAKHEIFVSLSFKILNYAT